MARQYYFWLLMVVVAIVPSAYGADIKQLELKSVYHVEANFPANPSGLSFCNGKLLVVSDKRDEYVYELVISPDGIARLAEYKHITTIPDKTLPPVPWGARIKRFIGLLLAPNKFDWEGVACEGSDLFLLSETAIDILHVSADGNSKWLNIPLFNIGYDAGFFQINNAYVEGLSIIQDGVFVIAAERQNRGLLKAEKRDDGWKVAAMKVKESPVLPGPGRVSDFSGLSLYKGKLFSLERNASAVCERSADTLEVVNCWSFQNVFDDSKYKYSDSTYGLAEGLAFADDSMFIVLDNNGDHLKQNTDDTRSLLFEFKIPRIE